MSDQSAYLFRICLLCLIPKYNQNFSSLFIFKLIVDMNEPVMRYHLQSYMIVFYIIV